MASISYLWKFRARFPIGSRLFYRAWAKRALLVVELIKRNRQRMALTRSGATISETAEIGDVKIDGQRNLLEVGHCSFLGAISIALHCVVKIGERVCINDGVQILTGSHDVMDPKWAHKIAPIEIQDYVWIGTSAIILPGVTLGRGCVVGAGAVVAKSVAPGAIVVGNPARVLPQNRCEELDYNPCEFLAANRAWILG